MDNKPERYHVDEVVVSIIARQYPDIIFEIRCLLEWYRPRGNRFEVLRDNERVEVLTHQDVYDRLIWTRGWRSDADAVMCNTQMLNLLKNSFGWHEENEKDYPNPHWII